MRAVHQALFTSMALLLSITPSSAAFWNCAAPEIDARSGTAAVSVIIAVALAVHHRYRAQ